jgi:hypothetical protein
MRSVVYDRRVAVTSAVGLTGEQCTVFVETRFVVKEDVGEVEIAEGVLIVELYAHCMVFALLFHSFNVTSQRTAE